MVGGSPGKPNELALNGGALRGCGPLGVPIRTGVATLAPDGGI